MLQCQKAKRVWQIIQLQSCCLTALSPEWNACLIQTKRQTKILVFSSRCNYTIFSLHELLLRPTCLRQEVCSTWKMENGKGFELFQWPLSKCGKKSMLLVSSQSLIHLTHTLYSQLWDFHLSDKRAFTKFTPMIGNVSSKRASAIWVLSPTWGGYITNQWIRSVLSKIDSVSLSLSVLTSLLLFKSFLQHSSNSGEQNRKPHVN